MIILVYDDWFVNLVPFYNNESLSGFLIGFAGDNLRLQSP